jgi:SAM-dependent methyltransferase
MQIQLDYGNWIRKRLLFILGSCALGIGLLTFLPFGFVYHIIMNVVFVVTFLSLLFPLYAFIMFSQKGGRMQEKIYNLIIQNLNVSGAAKILDIGSGNGVLAVKLAQRYTETEVTGMDYWGEDWEYSKGVCEKNAQLVGVSERVHFQKGDAARLDFESESFDGATSNLTFHEVKSAADARSVLQEALRIVKPSGNFAFVDYFFDEKYYGKKEDLEKFLKGLGISHFEYKPIGDLITLPLVLKHPRILGKVGIIYGRKMDISVG